MKASKKIRAGLGYINMCMIFSIAMLLLTFMFPAEASAATQTELTSAIQNAILNSRNNSGSSTTVHLTGDVTITPILEVEDILTLSGVGLFDGGDGIDDELGWVDIL